VLQKEKKSVVLQIIRRDGAVFVGESMFMRQKTGCQRQGNQKVSPLYRCSFRSASAKRSFLVKNAYFALVYAIKITLHFLKFLALSFLAIPDEE
jgi:hypothetical protein